jgi:hypothetical protein
MKHKVFIAMIPFPPFVPYYSQNEMREQAIFIVASVV